MRNRKAVESLAQFEKLSVDMIEDIVADANGDWAFALEQLVNTANADGSITLSLSKPRFYISTTFQRAEFGVRVGFREMSLE